MNKATALLWPDQGRSWADPVNNFGPAREESSNGQWVCWAGLNQAWEVTFSTFTVRHSLVTFFEFIIL